jgi:hypothetical protein
MSGVSPPPSAPGPDARPAGGTQGLSSDGTSSASVAPSARPETKSGHSSSSSVDPVAPSARPGAGGSKSDGRGNPAKSKSDFKRAQREERKSNAAEERRRVAMALWPNADIKKDLRDAAGQDPDPAKLLASTRFRDLWTPFSKESQPSTKTVSALRKLVVDIMTPKSRSNRSSTTSTSKSIEKSGNSKRKNRSLSLERSTPSKDEEHKKKIPRTGDQPANLGSPKTSSTPTLPRMPEEEDEDDDLVIDESHEPSVLDLADDLRSALPDYAGAAQGSKTSTDSPYILYVHVGKEERRKMSRETWTVLLEKVHSATLDLALAGKGVRIDWNGFAKGVGLFAPADADSRAAMKEIIDGITVAEYSFRAWAKGETGEYTPLTIRIPAAMTRKTFTAGKIMQAACLLNKLPENSHTIRDCKDVKDSKDRLLRITAKRDLVDAIIKLDGKLYVAATQLRVFYQRSPLNKGSKIP